MILEVRQVTKNFGGFRAVDAVSVTLAPGVIHAVIGANGAGKTTLINVIAGQLSPSAGDILFRGRSIAGWPPHRIAQAGIARSFQITAIFPGFTSFENVQIALLAHEGATRDLFRPVHGRKAREAMELLDYVRLADRAASPASTLAAGDRKRLEFAIALAAAPALMLLDEPTAGMSPDERELVTAIVRQINRERGVTVLFTEHDIEMVFSIAQRITVMHQGRVLADGPPDIVRGDPRVRDVYLGETGDA